MHGAYKIKVGGSIVHARRPAAGILVLLLVFFGITQGAAYAAGQVSESTAQSGELSYAIPDGQASEATSGSVSGEQRSAAASTSCSWTNLGFSGQYHYQSDPASYYADSPSLLQTLAWTGTLSISCSAPVVSLSVEMAVSNTSSGEQIVAEDACEGCSSLVVDQTGYTCIQGSGASGQDCSGPWTGSVVFTIEGNATDQWTPTSACSASGAFLACEYGGSVGYLTYALVPSYPTCAEAAAGEACLHEPTSAELVMDMDDIERKVRPSHFSGGSSVGDDKGLFDPALTNSDLEYIFLKGLLDDTPWKFNGETWEKTFDFGSSVGSAAKDYGGGSTSLVTVVAEATTTDGLEHITTMYPETPQAA